MPTAAQLPSVIRDKLSAMDRQQRELTALSGVGEFLCLAAVASGTCLIVDAYGNLSPAWRAGLLGGLAITLLAGLWYRVLRPFLRRRSWAELAAAVEHDHPELNERLTTLVELRADAVTGRVSSPLMQELLTKQTVKAVSQVEFTDTLPVGRSLQRGALGLAALAVLLLPFLMPGGRYALSWQRLLAPFGNYDWGHRLAFQIPNGDRVVPKGSDVVLQAELVGSRPTAPLDVQLRWVDANGQAHRRPMTWNDDKNAYELTLPRVEQSFHYHVTSRAAVSREYSITAADRPRIMSWHLELQPPSYTGLPAQVLDAAVSELTVPEHSRIQARWQFAEPVAAAEISWPELFVEHTPLKSDDAAPNAKVRTVQKSLQLSADRRSATVDLQATADGSFGITLTSDLGLDGDEPARKVILILDQPPQIEVANTDAVTTIQPDDVLPVPMIAEDDYGLSAVELHWKTSTGQQGSRAVPVEELSGREMAYRWELDVADWKLASGQSLTYRLRAVDNRPQPGPQETWTEPVTVAVSSQAELIESRELASAQAALEQELDALKSAVAEQQQAVDKEHRETAREAVRGDQQPENQAELDKLKERQQALREQLESLRDELQQRPIMEQAAKDHLPQIEEKLTAAEQSLEQAAESQEARDQIEKLSKSLDELAQAETQLEQLKKESQALAALEQELAELGRLSRKADKLADQAEALQRQAEKSKETAKPPAQPGDIAQGEPAAKNERDQPEVPATAEELDQLRKETEELTEHLDDLLRRRPELLEAARKHELDRLARLAEMAERLAQPQAQLAEAITREAAEDSPESLSDESPPADATAPAEDANSPENQPGDQPQTDQPQNNNPEAADSRNQTANAQTPQESPEANQTPAENAANPDVEPSNSSASEPRGENSQNPTDNSAAEKPEASPADETSQAAAKNDAASPNNNKNPARESESSLSQQVSRAVQQQQQLAREAAALQKSAAQDPMNSPPEKPADPSGAQPGESKPSPENAPAQQPTDGNPSSPRKSEQALADFAQQSQAAADAAKAGDLQQAAAQSQEAGQSAKQAAQTESQSEPQSPSPAGEKAGELAERQQALSQEFERLAQSQAARQQAQQQSQQQLKQATDSLAKALEKSAEHLQQQPLNQPKSGQCASGACQSAKSAGESMKAASESLAQGNPAAAGQQAQSARQQLQQAAQQAQAAQEDQPASTSQGSKVPGKTAGQVAQAAHQLKQAQEQLAQAGKPGSSSGSQSETSPDAGTQPSEQSPQTGGKPSAENSKQPGEPSPKSDSPSSEHLAQQKSEQPSALELSAEQLRQAAKSLSSACKACQNGGGKPGSGSKPGAPGKPGSPGKPGPQSMLAGKPAEQGDPGEPAEGLAAIGLGASEPSEELGSLTDSAKPSAGMRNWGRLPKNLQSEILQGSTKKSHPEYSRQIKNYFEQIAQPAAKQDRP